VDWPDGFWWGTGASSTQCEGAAPSSEWIGWERAGRAPVSGTGSDFAERYAEDFALYASLGLTHHRLGIDWSRIEPEQGRRDQAAVAHYREILRAAHDAGVRPWVCLLHFVVPQWFADLGDFRRAENRIGPWADHVAFVADTFGDLVDGWQPVNESNIYAILKFRGLGFAPGHDDHDESSDVGENIHLGAAEAAVRLRETGAPVSSIFSLFPAIAHDETAATAARIERETARNWEPALGLFADGALRIPDREPVERPDLAGSFDLIGFSYYGAFGVRDGELALHPPTAVRSPLGYGLWADGLALVLDRLQERVPGTPLLIAEYGIGTDDDAVRAEYLRDGLRITHDALQRGIDVRGLFHWTGVDNYEWLFGYDVRFGIIDADRTIRPSAKVLAEEALGTGA
jgi:beta-glucosidase